MECFSKWAVSFSKNHFHHHKSNCLTRMIFVMEGIDIHHKLGLFFVEIITPGSLTGVLGGGCGFRSWFCDERHRHSSQNLSANRDVNLWGHCPHKNATKSKHSLPNTNITWVQHWQNNLILPVGYLQDFLCLRWADGHSSQNVRVYIDDKIYWNIFCLWRCL